MPALPPPSLFKIEIQLPVRWGDMDALGHVNNAKYLTYFESARIAYFDQIGAFARYSSEGIGPILATTRCDYLSPVVYPATLLVGARVVKVGTTSFEMEYLIRDANDGRPCAFGTSVQVLFDYRNQVKTPIPAEVREAIRALDGI